MEKIKEKVVILYDGGDCSDGFGGAWTAWKKFGNGAKYIGVFHQSPIPEGLNNKIIYMIDFTYPEEITRKLIKDNITVTSIDHHVSVLKAIKLTKNYSYSENNSGSVLAWKYFFQKTRPEAFEIYRRYGSLGKQTSLFKRNFRLP